MGQTCYWFQQNANYFVISWKGFNHQHVLKCVFGAWNCESVTILQRGQYSEVGLDWKLGVLGGSSVKNWSERYWGSKLYAWKTIRVLWGLPIVGFNEEGRFFAPEVCWKVVKHYKTVTLRKSENSWR